MCGSLKPPSSMIPVSYLRDVLPNTYGAQGSGTTADI